MIERTAEFVTTHQRRRTLRPGRRSRPTGQDRRRDRRMLGSPAPRPGP